MRNTLLVATVIPLGMLLGCGVTTPSVIELEQGRSRWAGHHLTNYEYDYEMSGFFNRLSGQTVHVVVISDTIRTAVLVASGDTIPVPNASLATVDRLFAQAIAAREAGTLAGIQLDPVLGYPRRININGPPDASGSINVSHLKPLL